MSEWTLAARPALAGKRILREGLTLKVVQPTALVLIAVPDERQATLGAALGEAFGLADPATGRFTAREDGSARLVWLRHDQRMFIVFAAPWAWRFRHAFATEQTDGWVLMRLSGARSLAVLERQCSLDLGAAAMPPGAVQTTIMAHLSVTVLREDEQQFLLMTPSSSAGSLWTSLERTVSHAVATA